MEENKEKKFIDGIKPMDMSGVKRSRDLVLSSIGEKAASKKERKPSFPASSRKIDSIIPSQRLKEKKTVSESSPLLETEKDLPQPESAGHGEELIKETELPLEASGASVFSLDNLNPEAEKKLKKKAAQKKPIASVPQSEKKKEARKEKSKPKRRNKSGKWKLRLAYAFKFVLISASFSFFLYLVFAVLVYTFSVRLPFLSFVASKLYLPAVISSDGVIAYSDYLNLKKISPSESLDKELAMALLEKRLIKRYGTADKEKLTQKLPWDPAANVVAYNRIKKIDENIKEEGDFIKVAQKFGEVGQANLSTANPAALDFGPYVKDLAAGQTSGVLTTEKGFYIVHCFLKEGDNLSLSFIFIPSISVEDFLQESLTEYYFWKLVRG